MRRLFATILAALFVSAGMSQTWAEDEADWAAQFAGLEGVTIGCLRNLERKYTSRMCKAVMDHAAARLAKIGVPHEVIGTTYSRGATPQPAKKFARPLHLTVLVRATNPNPLGIDLRINASVPYKAAVENGDDGPARSGHLLMWQNGVTGAGPTRRLERASIKVAKERLDQLLDHIETAWPR